MQKAWISFFAILLLISASFPATDWMEASPFHSGGAGFTFANDHFYLHKKWISEGYRSTDGVAWTSFRDTSLKDAYVDRVVFVEGKFHAFAGSPTQAHLISTDGMHWTKQPLPIPCPFSDMTWGNGMFLGVSNCSDSQVATSPDGISWTSHDTKNGIEWNRICFGNGVFVAMNEGGPISSSSDGIDWTVVQGYYDSNLLKRNRDIAFGNGRFVIVGSGGRIISSSDGKVWKDSVALDKSGYYYSLIFAQGKFVAIDDMGGAYRSKDGLAWSPVSGYTNREASLAYGNGRYVALGSSGTAYSDDSTATWKLEPGRKESTLWGRAYTGKDFIVAGNNGALATSPDGLNWTECNSGVSANLSGVAWGNNRAVVIGYGGTILTSSDLVVWTNLIDPRLNFIDVVFGDSLFVGITGDGKIFASPDGATWNMTYSSPTDPNLTHVGFGNGVFIADGRSTAGTILRSSDGHHWTRTRNETIHHFLDGFIAYGNAGFFIGEDGGMRDTLYHTTDGTDLQPLKVPALSDLVSQLFVNAMTYGQGYYVATAAYNADGFVLYSSDGKNWQVDKSDNNYTHGIVYGGGKFLRLYNSVDGATSVTSKFDPVVNVIRPIKQSHLPRTLIGQNLGYEIFNLEGKILFRNKLPVNDSLSRANAPTLPQGTYFIRYR